MSLSRCRSVFSLMQWALQVLPAICLLSGCLNDREHGGGSETTVVGVMGKVVDLAGNPVAGAAVRIRPEGALPAGLGGAGRSDFADLPQAYTLADGAFLITDIPPGAYFVECRGQVSGAALVAVKVPVADSLVRLPDAVLQPTGAVKGRLRVPADAQAILLAAYIYIPGIRERVVATSKDSFQFVLGNIPAGTYAFRAQPAFPSDLSYLRILEIPGVRILPDDTLDLDSLDMPLRVSIADPSYSRDSAAVHALLSANAWFDTSVIMNSAVTGNRITMIYDFQGRIVKIPKEIEALDKLEVLYLRGVDTAVRLEVAPEIARLSGLKRLWLQNHAVDGLPSWARSFRELASLMLSEAGLKSFPEGVVDYPFLAYLDLAYNGIPSISPVIRKLQRLAVMDLSGNELTVLPPELLAMESLKGVRVRHNRLCSLTPEWKAWVTRQDSLWITQADPLSYFVPGVDSGWEASQRCGESP